MDKQLRNQLASIVEGAGDEYGLTYPFVVVIAAASGGIHGTRQHGDGRAPELLVAHDPDEIDTPLSVLVIDETGAEVTVVVPRTGSAYAYGLNGPHHRRSQ
jgi:hypothetical protein